MIHIFKEEIHTTQNTWLQGSDMRYIYVSVSDVVCLRLVNIQFFYLFSPMKAYH